MQKEYYGSNVGYLYDAQEWVNWNAMREKELLSDNHKRIELLESHVNLLKEILTSQGVRIVTEADAKSLELTKALKL